MEFGFLRHRRLHSEDQRRLALFRRTAPEIAPFRRRRKRLLNSDCLHKAPGSFRVHNPPFLRSDQLTAVAVTDLRQCRQIAEAGVPNTLIFTGSSGMFMAHPNRVSA